MEFTTNMLFYGDCMDLLPTIPLVDLTLTDIPYDEVTRDDSGLRNLDKGAADILTFNLIEFLDLLYAKTKSTIIIFCGKGQFSNIYKYFDTLPGTVRQLVWEKTNPSPMNGQYVYLSGTENAVWFRKPKGTFNAHCKNTVFRFSNGRNKLHPTEKNPDLISELILDNSNEGDLVLDPCMGSGTHLVCAKALNRRYLGIELNKEYYDIAKDRLCNI